jgi:hypothetical protein
VRLEIGMIGSDWDWGQSVVGKLAVSIHWGLGLFGVERVSCLELRSQHALGAGVLPCVTKFRDKHVAG